MDSDAYTVTWFIVFIIIMIPTVFGNGLILYSVAKFPRLRSNIHILIANLAISDLIVGAVLIPTELLSTIFGWKSNKYVCLTTLGFYVLSFGTSCYNLLLISIERFIAICYPFRARTMLTKPKMVLMICLGWIIIAVNTMIPFYGVNTFTNSTECVNISVWPKAYQTYNDWLLLSSVLINFVFYTIVVRIAIKKAHSKYNIKEDTNFNTRTNANIDIHHVITMVIVLGTFIVCWLPYITLSAIVTFWDTPNFQYVKKCAFIPGLFNSAMNWLIYGYRNKEFSKAFKRTLKCKFRNEDDKRPTSFSTVRYTSDIVA